MACPRVSWGIVQGPAEFNRRSRRLLSCPLRSAWFRDSVPRLCPGEGHFPTIQPVTEVQRLTWEQYLAGEPCRGCGRPMRDATLWSGSGKGLIHLSEEERAQYDSEEQHFKVRHADCHTHRWTLMRGRGAGETDLHPPCVQFFRHVARPSGSGPAANRSVVMYRSPVSGRMTTSTGSSLVVTKTRPAEAQKRAGRPCRMSSSPR